MLSAAMDIALSAVGESSTLDGIDAARAAFVALHRSSRSPTTRVGGTAAPSPARARFLMAAKRFAPGTSRSAPSPSGRWPTSRP